MAGTVQSGLRYLFEKSRCPGTRFKRRSRMDTDTESIVKTLSNSKEEDSADPLVYLSRENLCDDYPGSARGLFPALSTRPLWHLRISEMIGMPLLGIAFFEFFEAEMPATSIPSFRLHFSI